jgi:signal transduction histidine kinase
MVSNSLRIPNSELLPSFLLAATFVVAFVILDRISFIHSLRALNITPWNPQPALAIALIALRGYRWIAPVFVAVLAAEILVRGLPVSLGYAILLSAILTCGYVAIAWLLRSPLAVTLDLRRRKDLLNLAAGVVAGAGVTGLVFVGALCLGGVIPWSYYVDAVFRFWLGDTIGVLVTLPLLLLIADFNRRRELAALLRSREVLLQLGVVTALLIVVFAMEEGEQVKYFYLLFLPLIWIAARHGLAAAIGAVALIQVGVIVSVIVTDDGTLTVIETQILLLALTLAAFLLGVTVDEWRFASERLARVRQLTVASEMATALAHELTQPLTAMSTYADAIRLLVGERGGEAAPLIEAAERIQRTAARSADIVARLRALGSTCPGRLERISLEEPLQAGIAAVAERTQRLGAVIHVSRPDGLPAVLIDRDRIAFVFQNLLANSLDAIERCAGAERSIAIALRLEGATQIAVTVRDSGAGVRPEMTEKIFEPFYSGKVKGMGLGLALSRSIVESHGGRLWPEPAGHGLFQVRLPL